MIPHSSIESSEIVDFIRVEGNVYTHKQIERRNGRLYMRLKRRLLPIEV